MLFAINLDTPLLRLAAQDYFTLRDAVQGVSIMGGIGSGKTSGSGKALAAAYLRAGMGGLILCAKPEEAELWRQYCAQCGRSKSLIEFNGSHAGFNFIAYELARQGAEGLNSVVECLMRVLEMARAAGPSPGRAGDVFWEDTTRQILRNTIPIVHAATGTVRIEDVLRFVRSAPTSPQQMTDRAWQSRSEFFARFFEARPHIGEAAGARAVSYWADDFATLDAKTRGNILISLTTALDRFNHGWLQRAFCAETTIVPELTFHGAIILLNMPALTRNEDGIVAQQLFKYMWQRAVLARNVLPAQHRERPVFLWADEAQYFVNSYDSEFLSTARGSRACTVYLSQSLPTYYAKVQGENAHDRVHHLLGNFATRIWHSNACAETNEWAARTLGKALQQRASYNENEGTSENTGLGINEGRNWGQSSGSSHGWSSSSQGGSSTGSFNSGTNSGGNEGWNRSRGESQTRGSTRGYSEQMDFVLEPASFGRIFKTGGPANAHRVSALWYQAGRTFAASRGNALLAEFRQ